MPSWPIHIALANKLNQKLNLGDDFILGNVLPDVLDGYIFKPSNITDKNFSHYRTNGRIDYDMFFLENKDKLDNPIVLGYLIHLVTDKFYNKYTAMKHFIKTDDGMYVLLSNDEMIKKSNDTLIMKQKEYFKYGKMLADKNRLGFSITVNDKSFGYLKDLSRFHYSEGDIMETTELINKWVNNKINNEFTNYNIYTKEELDKMFNDCYLFILEYLKKLRETN